MGPEPVVGQVTPNQGSFFLVEAANDFQPITEVTPVSISNGLAWNRDNTLLYYIDTATGQVDVFDFNVETASICKFNITYNGIQLYVFKERNLYIQYKVQRYSIMHF